MSGKKFLEIVEKSGLLEGNILAELRRQVAENKGKVTAESIAKTLVDRGHLTKFQATKLVGETTADLEDQEKKQARKNAEDDLLGLAPLDDDEQPIVPAKPTPAKSPPAKPAPTKSSAAKSGSSKTASRGRSQDDDEEVVMLEDAAHNAPVDVSGLTPVVDAGVGLTPIGHDAGALSPMPRMHGLELGGSSGGGDLLGGPATLDPFATPGGGAAGGPKPYVPKKKVTVWDTKLMLGGGTALLIMILIAGLMIRNLFAIPAVQMWEEAEKAYNEAGNYPDAKDRYEKYLAAHPKDENSGKAKVRLRVIRIRLDSGDPERGLTALKEELPIIAKEPEAEMAREEYPAILPLIPEGFIAKAKIAKDTKTKEELLTKAKEAMGLVTDPEYIPTSKRTLILPQLNRMNEDIQLVERTINAEKELANALTDIGSAEQSGETAKAYQRYKDLLKNYPEWRDNTSLKEAVLKIATREKGLVKTADQAIAPMGAEEARISEFCVVLASRSGGGEAKPQNPVATVLAGGSVYALDAGNGQILWRRFVGHGCRVNPIRFSAQPDADVLLVDRQHNELVRVKARTGELAWRLPIKEQFSDPAISGARIYVSTHAGRVLEIDATTGESKRHAVIPQKLTVAPAAATEQPYLFQIGEHSNIYVLNTETLQCVDVIYLGHKAGTIDVPPLVLMGHVFVAENTGVDRARVHALKIRTEDEGPKLFATQEPVNTVGRVVVPMVVYSRRLLVLSDRGEIRVFDVDKTKTKDSVTDTGKLAGTLTSPMSGYPLAYETTLWVADNKLTKFLVQVTRKEIVRDPAITGGGDTFVAPLQAFGGSLIHFRRPANSTGVLVTAVNVDNPRQTLWQTHLGVPAGRIAVNLETNEIIAISSGASLFQINGEVLKSGYSDTPLATAPGSGSLSFTEPIEFDKNVVAFFNPADNRQLLAYDPAVPQARLRIVPLQLNEGKVTCTPIAYLGGLLAPSDKGEILLLKLADGSPQVLPFQPKLEPGEKIRWRRPALVGAGGNEFVIADDRKNIYRVGVKDSPQPHLAELASNRLEVELTSGLAAIGENLYGVVRTNGGDLVVSISSADLKVGKEWDLKGGRVTWGPERVGDVVMVVTDEKELRCFAEGDKEVWSKPAVMHGQPAGKPLLDGDAMVFASVGGAVWRINAASGEETGKAELGEPLGAGPVAFRGRLLLCGNDGALHVIPMPTGGSSG